MTNVILRLNPGDSVVNTSLDRLKKKFPGDVATATSNLDKIGKLKSGDRLFVLGHGNRSALGKLSAHDLADLLAKAGLKSGVTVELVACNSGSGGAPFALELKQQLVSHKIVPKSVSGGTNYMVVDDTGAPGTRTAARGADGKLRATGTVTQGTQREQTPWGERTRRVDPTYRTGGN